MYSLSLSLSHTHTHTHTHTHSLPERVGRREHFLASTSQRGGPKRVCPVGTVEDHLQEGEGRTFKLPLPLNVGTYKSRLGHIYMPEQALGRVCTLFVGLGVGAELS